MSKPFLEKWEVKSIQNLHTDIRPVKKNQRDTNVQLKGKVTYQISSGLHRRGKTSKYRCQND